MKRLTITPEIQERLNAAGNGPVDPSKVAVFETVAMSADPINQPGSIYDGATFDESLWQGMASFLNSGGSVPVQIMHETGELNQGRAIYAGIRENSLRAQFYLMADSPLVEQIENGIVNQVSVNVLAKKMICSASDYDFAAHGDEGWERLMWDRADPDGNVIGENGVHIHMVGFSRWDELSLVNTGASPGAKILAPASARLRKKSLDHSWHIPLARFTTVNVNSDSDASPAGGKSTEEDEDMPDTEGLLAALTAATKAEAKASAKLELNEQTVADLKAQVASLTASLETANATIKSGEARVKQAETDQAELKAAQAYLTTMTQRALTASKSADAPKPDVQGMIDQIAASGRNLANLAAQEHATTTDPAAAPAANLSRFAAGVCFRLPERN